MSIEHCHTWLVDYIHARSHTSAPLFQISTDYCSESSYSICWVEVDDKIYLFVTIRVHNCLLCSRFGFFCSEGGNTFIIFTWTFPKSTHYQKVKLKYYIYHFRISNHKKIIIGINCRITTAFWSSSVCQLQQNTPHPLSLPVLNDCSILDLGGPLELDRNNARWIEDFWVVNSKAVALGWHYIPYSCNEPWIRSLGRPPWNRSLPGLRVVTQPTVLEPSCLLFDIPGVIKTKALRNPQSLRSPCVWTSTT